MYIRMYKIYFPREIKMDLIFIIKNLFLKGIKYFLCFYLLKIELTVQKKYF